MSTDRAVSVARNDDGSSITVHHQGAHLTSWRNKNNEELIYTSPKAVYKDGVAIRGGVPLIFPQFSNMGPLRSHGFARIRAWTLQDIGNGKASFTLSVSPSELFEPNAKDPQSFTGDISLLYTITFSNDALQLEVEIVNHDPRADAEFAFAFHTYFAVADIRQTLLNGVSRTDFVDFAAGGAALRPCEETTAIARETDRLYPAQPCAVMLLDLARRRTLHISSSMPDAVVWNPWEEKTRRTSDLPADGYTRFVCVEHGAIQNKVKLGPRGTWRGSQCVRLLATSESS